MSIQEVEQAIVGLQAEVEHGDNEILDEMIIGLLEERERRCEKEGEREVLRIAAHLIKCKGCDDCDDDRLHEKDCNKCSKGADDAGGEVEEQEERKAYEERVKENLRKIKKRPVHERKIVHGRNNVSNKILKIKSFSLFTSNALAFQTPWRQDVEEYSDCVDQTLEILHKKKISESKTLLQEEKDFFLLWNSFLR